MQWNLFHNACLVRKAVSKYIILRGCQIEGKGLYKLKANVLLGLKINIIIRDLATFKDKMIQKTYYNING
jgi:hypothetical protein